MYWSSTSMRSPGRMLPTRMLKTLGRDCSSSEALLPSRDRLLEGGLGFLALLDLRDHPVVADGHGHAVHGGAGGPGEDVFGVDRPRAPVHVDLGDADARDHAADRGVHAGGLERDPVHLRVAVLDEEVGRERLARPRARRPPRPPRAVPATATIATTSAPTHAAAAFISFTSGRARSAGRCRRAGDRQVLMAARFPFRNGGGAVCAATRRPFARVHGLSVAYTSVVPARSRRATGRRPSMLVQPSRQIASGLALSLG